MAWAQESGLTFVELGNPSVHRDRQHALCVELSAPVFDPSVCVALLANVRPVDQRGQMSAAIRTRLPQEITVRLGIGRFIQPDPSGQETNPYLYASGDPVNQIGPNGLFGFKSFIKGVGHTLVAGGSAFGAGAGFASCYPTAGAGCAGGVIAGGTALVEGANAYENLTKAFRIMSDPRKMFAVFGAIIVLAGVVVAFAKTIGVDALAAVKAVGLFLIAAGVLMFIISLIRRTARRQN